MTNDVECMRCRFRSEVDPECGCDDGWWAAPKPTDVPKNYVMPPVELDDTGGWPGDLYTIAIMKRFG